MCVFCQIAAREIPCYKVYEDERLLAFLDIKPISPGHTLVITKEHYQNLEAVPDDLLAALSVGVKLVGALLKNRLGVPGYNVTCNNDPIAGQLIPHLHFHIIPRQAGDGCLPWAQHDYLPGEAEEIIKKLTN